MNRWNLWLYVNKKEVECHGTIGTKLRIPVGIEDYIYKVRIDNIIIGDELNNHVWINSSVLYTIPNHTRISFMGRVHLYKRKNQTNDYGIDFIRITKIKK